MFKIGWLRVFGVGVMMLASYTIGRGHGEAKERDGRGGYYIVERRDKIEVKGPGGASWVVERKN